MSDADYIRQRLYQAMDALAVSTEGLQQRLAHAGQALLPLPSEYFSDDDDRAQFDQIMDALTGYELGGEAGPRSGP